MGVCVFLIFHNPFPRAKKNLVFSLSSAWVVPFILFLFLFGNVLIAVCLWCLSVGNWKQR